MSARFVRVDTVGNSVTRQTLYDLLGNSTVDGFNAPVAQNVVSQTEPPTLDNSIVWFDQANQLLKIPVTNVDGSAASFWLSIGPDSWWYPGYNVSGETIRRGEWCCWSYSSTGTYDVVPMAPSPEYTKYTKVARGLPNVRCVCGPAQATIAANEFGPICTSGFAVALYDARSSHVTMGEFNNKDRYMVPSTCYTGVAQEVRSDTEMWEHPNLMGFVVSFPEVGSDPAAFPEYMLMPCFVNLPWGAQDFKRA